MKRKITLTLTMAALTLLTARGQTTAQDAVFKMKQEALTAENILVQMEYSVRKDKHKEMEVQIHDLEKSLAALQDQTVYLNKDHKDGLTAKINDMKPTISAFKKIVHKSRLFDKDKELKSEFQRLETKLTSIKSYIDFIQNELDKAETEEQKEQAHQEGHQKEKDRDKAIINIKPKTTELETQVNKVAAAFKKSDLNDVAAHSRNIQQLCIDISALNEGLEPSERTAIATSLVAIKKKAGTLETLAKEGHSKHDQAHDEFDAIKKEFAKLKTQINALN